MDTTPSLTKPTFSNLLLQALPADEVRRLRPHLTRVRLVNGAVLYHAGDRIEHVFFVEQGFISMVALADGAESRVEVGLIGRESLVGALALLSPGATSYVQAMVQMPGAAYRIPTIALLACIEPGSTMRRLILHAFEASLAQLAQTAACYSRHTVPERLARWLLMAHDRVDGDHAGGAPARRYDCNRRAADRRAGPAQPRPDRDLRPAWTRRRRMHLLSSRQ